jgi:type I restriction enzyme S subunit
LFDRELPRGWTVTTVDAIKAADKSACVAGPFGSDISSKYFTPEGVPVIRGSNLTDDLTRFVPKNFVFVSPERAASYRPQHVRAGDLVFTCWGTIGQVGLIPANGPFPEYIISNKQLKLRPNRALADPVYLFYYFASPQMVGHVRNRAIGAAVPGINLGILKTLEVVLPPLTEQRRIASVLSAYDDLIENNTRRIAILEEMARRIYEEWFVRFRFPGHEGVRMVESELGLVPEGWEVVRMEEVCARITDGSHYSPKSIEAGKPMASVKDMHDWGINVETCRQIAEDEYEKLVRNDCKPKLNDVLIAKDGSYLKHTFVVDQEIDLVILSSIAILRPNGRMLPNQLAMYLRLPDVASRMKGYVSGVAIPRIVLRDFRQFLVLLPPAKVQRAWAAHCDPMLTLCRNLVRKNENLRTTRDLLLPKLISGELDVSAMPEPEALAA